MLPPTRLTQTTKTICGMSLILCGSNIVLMSRLDMLTHNSIAGFKFQEIKTWLLDGRFDILVISETKIDSTFPDSHFHIYGFRMCRADRTRGGGGLMVYIRTDLCVKIVWTSQISHLVNGQDTRLNL